MEYFDLYDENRVNTGKKILRGEPCPQNLNRITIHLCIFNSKGEMLIQQRSNTKKSFPNVWDISLGGCVQAGETSKQAVQRELFEELGIDFNFENQRPFLTVNFDGGFDDYYIIKKDIDLKDVKFRDGEVQAVKWASIYEIIKLIGKRQFIQYNKHLIQALYLMKDKRGAFYFEKE